MLNAFRYLTCRDRSGRLSYFAPFYMVETGNFCRLRCSFCCQGNYSPHVHSARSMLRLADFEHILDRIAPYALVLDLFKHGEPFLNPEILSIIRAASSRHVRCRVNSGMNFDLNPETAREICRSGLYKLTCAIDGVTQEVYEKYRVNGDLALALRNAALLLEARRELGRSRPVMVYRMLVFEWNQHQVNASRELALRLGFDQFIADPGVFVLEGRPVQWDIQSRCWRDTRWYLDSIYPAHSETPPLSAPKGCRTLFHTMVLHSDGSSMVCCHSSRKHWQHENLLEKTLEEVWNSPSYQATRRAALGLEPAGPTAFPQCRDCCWL
jgi:MoaA/NifB/PqqE/SkfB family radical SAM enzyme